MENFTTKHGAETPIRALSWKQPYLDLMLHGKIETRTWATNYRGWVLMCASQKEYTVDQLTDISGEVQIERMIEKLGFEFAFSTTGQALAIGRLVDCRPMLPTDEAKTFVQYRAPWEEVVKRKKWRYSERMPGQFYPVQHIVEVTVNKQLYCHIYEDVQAIEPMPWKGCQGWRTVSDIFKAGIIIK